MHGHSNQCLGRSSLIPDSPTWRLHQGRRISLCYFQQDSHGVHLVIGRLNLCQLNQGDPKRPDVSLVVIRTVLGRLAHHHLWSHPGRKQGTLLKGDLWILIESCTNGPKVEVKWTVYFYWLWKHVLFYVPLTSRVFQWKSLSSATFWCFWQTHRSQLEDMWFKANQKWMRGTPLSSFILQT